VKLHVIGHMVVWATTSASPLVLMSVDRGEADSNAAAR
jgi:hypothetical protein